MSLKNSIRLAAAICLASASLSAAANPIDLAGSWRFALDPQDLGIRAQPADWKFSDSIRLPGMVNAQGFGEIPSIRTKWTGDGWRYPEMFKEWQADDNFKFPFFLQPPRHYLGPAWFQRDVDIPRDWAGRELEIELERVKWLSTLWIDGVEVCRGDSLGTPHVFRFGPLEPGTRTLTLRLDNRLGELNPGPLSHSVTDHTQGNWNGVVGRMELRALPPNRIDRVDVFPANDGSVRLLVRGMTDPALHEATLMAEIRPIGEGGFSSFARALPFERAADGAFRVEIRAELPAAPRLWDEFDPALHLAEVGLFTGDDMAAHSFTTVFGFREPRNEAGTLTLNGRPAYLRGTLECAIFPLTGHPPTDLDSWKRIISICKAHGLNHIRFHSWCPPKAAFEAADLLGFYLMPEVSSWANQGAEIGSGRPLDAWIEAETRRMIDAYGNHPSFLLMAYGNEPAGPNHTTWLQQWVGRWKQNDPRRLYTTAAGWPVMPGSDFHSSPNPRIQRWGESLKSILNGQPPRTDFDWRDFVAKHPDAPVLSHEIGQWCAYPNFDEIPKYTGHFKARNFEIFRETARRNGLLPQARDFLMASGKWQAAAYKHDIEAALRTPRFAGFQLLDLHDFSGQGTALVGVLDAFWDSKGYLSAEEYARFAGPVVPLARLPKMVWQTHETLTAEIQLSHFGPADFPQLAMPWSLAHEGETINSGKFSARDLSAGALHDVGSLSIDLSAAPAPAMLTLTVGDPALGFSNHWELFVYPQKPATGVPPNVIFTHDLDEALAALDQGRRVLWCPPAGEIADDPGRPLVAGFSPVFWNTAWTNWQPPHTLGILCDPAYPALASFPTQFHSNWQWWELQHQARPFILTKHHPLKPVVQVIDDWFTNRKLGYVFEASVGHGHLIASAFDLTSHLESRPAARQLRASLLAHAATAMAPAFSLTADDLRALLRPPALITRASAGSQHAGYPAANAIDGKTSTLWHTDFGNTEPPPPHDLQLGFRHAARVDAVVLTQRQDRNPNGQVAEVEILAPDGSSLARAEVPRDARAHRIPLANPPALDGLTLRVHRSHAGPFACLAEVEVEITSP